jgi:tetratricopeptide (TPR) repeat protein
MGSMFLAQPSALSNQSATQPMESQSLSVEENPASLAQADGEQLYSPAMLAELLHVSVRLIRRWQRAGLLEPTATVMQLPHFSFSQITIAKRLVQWMKQGASVQSIQHQLALIRERLNEPASLDSLPIVVVGKRLVLCQGETVMEATGQFHFGFDEPIDEEEPQRPATINFEQAARGVTQSPTAKQTHLRTTGAAEQASTSLEHLVEQAITAEDADDYDTAIEWYRCALAAHGPNPDICFQLAELLYRQGDLPAARERYFMALELDPGLVEAQANLGCVLAECGQFELAIAAFEGALQQFHDYADVHFHLARVLDDTGQTVRATEHWQRFLDLAPASPWAEEAAQRLHQSDVAWLDF